MNIRQPIATNYGDWASKFNDLWKDQVSRISALFGESIERVHFPQQDLTEVPIFEVKKERVIELLTYLKSEKGFEYNFLADLTATDEEVEPRFRIVYQLFSTVHKTRVRVKASVKEGEEFPSAISLWPGANWAEREVFDMFGVRFAGHPDLRRVLMDERWVGHPLRKDYPLRGYQLFTEPEPIHPELLKNS